MKHLYGRQDGITMMGLIFILAIIGILVLFAVRAFPLYNEKFQVISAMESVASKTNSNTPTDEVRKLFLRNLQATSNISRFDSRNIKDYLTVTKPKSKSDPRMIHVSYQATNTLFADLQLLLVFDKQIPLGEGSGN